MIRVLTEKAGFSPEDAQVIAYASQYTDGAVEHFPMQIQNLPELDFRDRVDGEWFDPICTAHRGIQYFSGIFKDVQRKVYIPFHFLPSDAYEGQGRYNYRCVPDGNLARGLVREAAGGVRAAEGEERTRKLIRLGIALHTCADTWFHQRFSGRWNGRDNDVERIAIRRDGRYEILPFFDHLKLNLVRDVGHAEALYFPDQTHLEWKYEHDASGIEYTRDNTALFLEAAQSIYEILCDADGRLGNWKSLVNKLKECFSLSTDSLKEKFRKYRETFPGIAFEYHEDEWRSEALKGESFDWLHFEEKDFETQRYEFNGDLEWFYFHMAAYDQRRFAIGNIRRDLL